MQDSAYNLDPESPENIDDFTAAMLKKEGKELSDLDTEIVDAPFVQVRPGIRSPVAVDPLGLTSEDRHAQQVLRVFQPFSGCRIPVLNRGFSLFFIEGLA